MTGAHSSLALVITYSERFRSTITQANRIPAFCTS